MIGSCDAAVYTRDIVRGFDAMPLNDQLIDLVPLLFSLAAGAILGGILGYLLAKVRLVSLFSVEKERLINDHQHQCEQLETNSSDLKHHYASLKTLLQAERSNSAHQLRLLQETQKSYSDNQQALADQGAELASLKTELALEQRNTIEKLKELKQSRQQLTSDFELLANRIFDEKTESFTKNSQNSLNMTLTPLREQLVDFKKKVEDVYDKDSKERVSLVAELTQLKDLNKQMSLDALNLTNALKGDNKAQGNWGEVILERVLEESGLHKGREYETQLSFKSEDGLSRPDVIVRLPDNKDIVIDSKVSLVHYERYCHSSGDDQNQAIKDHVRSVREHIKGLSTKHYENLEGLRTLDFVFIFIPIEPAFMAAFEHDQSMFKEAYEKNIIIVGPTTLLATLRTIQSIWRYERQNKNAEVIARQAGAMHDKFVGFINDIEKISEHLERAQLAQANAMNKLVTGKGNLVSSVQRIEKLGAKVKKTIPSNMTQPFEETKGQSIETSSIESN